MEQDLEGGAEVAPRPRFRYGAWYLPPRQWRLLKEGEGLEGKFHEQADAKWMVVRGPQGVIIICPEGGQPLVGQPLVGLSAARGLAALRAYLVFLVTINY
jgi:hypothetical protein